MPVREGCRQLPPSYVAYFGTHARTLGAQGIPDALWSREVGQAWQTYGDRVHRIMYTIPFHR
jgi:hypothetical protein